MNDGLLDYVKKLEGKGHQGREQVILDHLAKWGLFPRVQHLSRPRISNIIVDFLPESRSGKILFSAHYDAVTGSPGANDNASGVAVLLGLCYRLRNARLPARVVFFDREEAWVRTPLLRLGLLGSLYYALTSNLKGLSAVYNVEFCGLGDFLAVWSVKKNTRIPAIAEIETVCPKVPVNFRVAYLPWPFISSDHLSFRLKGFANAVTLSLIPSEDLPAFEHMAEQTSFSKLITGRIKTPKPLSFIHGPEDTSSKLDEHSLDLMLSILLKLLPGHLARQATGS